MSPASIANRFSAPFQQTNIEVVMMHTFNSSTHETEAGICVFKAILVYRESSRTARLHRETVSKQEKEKK